MKIFPALASFGTLLATASAASTAVAIDPDTLGISAPPNTIIAKPIVQQPKIEFAVINTPDTDYLQTEFSGLAAGMGVRIDSISGYKRSTMEGLLRANLEVHWRWAASDRDTVYPTVRRMQFLEPLKLPTTPNDSILGHRVEIEVDTIWTCQDGRCLIASSPKVVSNYRVRQPACMVLCSNRDSSEIVMDVRERIRSSGLALVLHPSHTFPAPIGGGWWTTTTGEEEYQDLCARLPGNLGNWHSRDRAVFDVAPVAYLAASKPSIPASIEYPTGPVQYTYNRTSAPYLKIWEGLDVRQVNDTLVKFGRTMSLTGSTRAFCGRPVDDSAVAHDSWLVLPSDPSGSSIETALAPIFCGRRNSAWRMSGDTVWLANTTWPVLLQDLLRTSSIQGKLLGSASGDAPKLVGTRVELPWSATVLARDLSGRRLGASAALTAGSHELDLAGHRGAFVLEIRSQDGKQSRSLRGSAFAR